MPVFLAMSCLQGRPMHEAFDELVALAPDGIQLTPGNAPTTGFIGHARASGVCVRTHHGFCLSAIRAPVWRGEREMLGVWDSVHPPREAAADWMPPEDLRVCLETMYPGLALGSGEALEVAMDAGLDLAVDVSHIHIQIEQGAMQASVWRRLQDYSHVREIHLSANDGRRDQHRPFEPDMFGLSWARERGQDCALPVIIECYMHRLSHDERLQQLSIARGDA